MKNSIKAIILVLLGMLFFSDCQKKETPMLENGFYFNYNKYNAVKYGGCVAGGIVNYTWDVNLVNIPETGGIDINSDYFSNNCSDCCGIQVSNNPLTERYIAVSGRLWREGSLIAFDVECRRDDELSDGRNYKLKGSYICDQD